MSRAPRGPSTSAALRPEALADKPVPAEIARRRVIRDPSADHHAEEADPDLAVRRGPNDRAVDDGGVSKTLIGFHLSSDRGLGRARNHGAHPDEAPRGGQA